MSRSFTRLTWDNAAFFAPSTAKRLGLQTNDVVEIDIEHATLTAPVFVLPGQAAECIYVAAVGWGRAAGGLGVGAGFDAYRARRSTDPWFASVAGLTKTNRIHQLATTRDEDRMLGRDLVREASLEQFDREPQ